MEKGKRRVITISHLYGSGGSRIAQELGRRLGFAVWDKEVVRQIATQYELAESVVESKDERVDSFIERMVGIFGASGFEAVYQVPVPLWLNDAQLVKMTRAIIEQGAEKGRAIVVGRGGQCILAKRPEVLHVFIFAPLPVRIERVMTWEGLERAKAESRIADVDRLRHDYVRTFYRADWRDPSFYHLLIDSGLWGEERTADLIESAFKRLSL
jgi:cytidylate kinase